MIPDTFRPIFAYSIRRSRIVLWLLIACWVFNALALIAHLVRFVNGYPLFPYDRWSIAIACLLVAALCTGAWTTYQNVGGRYIRYASFLGAMCAGIFVLIVAKPAVIEIIYGPEPDIRIVNECRSRIVRLSGAIRMYALVHDGHYPSSLQDLLVDHDVSSIDFTCPATVHSTIPAKYRYFGSGERSPLPSQKILLAEQPHNHGRLGFHIVRGDGSVEYVEASRAKAILRVLQDADDRLPD